MKKINKKFQINQPYIQYEYFDVDGACYLVHAQLHAVFLVFHVIVFPATFEDAYPDHTRRQQLRQVGVRRDARVQALPVDRKLALGRGGLCRVVEAASGAVIAFARAHVVITCQLAGALWQLLHKVRLEEPQDVRHRLHAFAHHAGILGRRAEHGEQAFAAVVDLCVIAGVLARFCGWGGDVRWEDLVVISRTLNHVRGGGDDVRWVNLVVISRALNYVWGGGDDVRWVDLVIVHGVQKYNCSPDPRS